ncbi:MAG: ATP-binding protein [bacterium]|nr:ATP-binding protein [bacterium]
MNNKIYKRDIFEEISKYLYDDGIIVLHGARQVGKTHLLYYLENYLKDRGALTYYIDLEDERFLDELNKGAETLNSLLEEKLDIKSFSTTKKVFVFIDEIQYLKNPSSFLKLVADHYKYIKLIISGSSSFEIKKKFKNSLVGRTINFEIFPLSFNEFLLFKNYPLKKEKNITSNIIINELKELYKEFVLFGSYPQIVLTKNIEKKEKFLEQIINTYVRKDIRDLADIKDINKFNKLLRILSAQNGQLLNITELANTADLAKPTVEKYLFLLENTYIIKLLKPFSRNVRSELFKTPKIYFYDTGLCHLLWLRTLPREIIGHSFEASIFTELLKKYQSENIFYWRTQDKKEIDFILTIKNNLLPIEVKLNFKQFNKTAINYFIDKYKINKYKIAGLDGEKKENCIYPWEL